MEKIRGILIHSAYTAAADGGDLLEGDVPEELHHVCEVVLVLAVAGARVRLEQEVPRGELECHAGRAPDVCRGAVTRPQDHLQRPEGGKQWRFCYNQMILNQNPEKTQEKGEY